MVSAPGAGIPNNFQDPAISRPLTVGFGMVAIATAAGFAVGSPGPPALASDGVELAIWLASGAKLRKTPMPMKIKESDDKIKVTCASALVERIEAKIKTSRFHHAASSVAGLHCANA